MTNFAVERTVQDWTGQGMPMAEILNLKLANERTVLKEAKKAGGLTLVGKEEEWEVFDSLGQKKKKKWRGYFELGERKYCTMQRGQTLWTLIDDLAQKEMQGMFEKLGGSKVPHQWHKQILSGVADGRKMLKNALEKGLGKDLNLGRAGLIVSGFHSAGQIKWEWIWRKDSVEFNIYSSWGYAQIVLKVFKNRWGIWDFAVDGGNNKWERRKNDDGE